MNSVPAAHSPNAPGRADPAGEAVAVRRSWATVICGGLAAIYLPLLLPFVIGPLTECAHCIQSYLRWFPVVPGAIAGVPFFQQSPPAGIAVAATVTVTLLAGVLSAFRRLPRGLLIALCALLAVALAFEALGFAAALRA